MAPAPVIDQDDANKDHNGNGVVCKKLAGDKIVGGPDETVDDILQ